MLFTGELVCAILSHLPANKPDLVSSQVPRDEMLCAMWVDSPILCGPLTIETLHKRELRALCARGMRCESTGPLEM
jgi:hypothetical protein